MEKPTGVIQKIIESLQQVNTLDVYSPIEKDIILHNLRAAYMIFLNIPTKEESTENRVEELFVEVDITEKEETEKEEMEKEEMENDDEVIEEIVEEPLVEETSVEKIEETTEPLVTEAPLVEETSLPSVSTDEPEEEIIELGDWNNDQEEEIVEETLVEETSVEEIEEPTEPYSIEETLVEEIEEPTEPEPLVTEAPLVDDILEFIPDAKPQSGLLFEDMVPKTEKKSLNDLLTEKKDDQSLGAKFQQSFIPDLTKAIAINEKFTFIKELFKNSGVDFSNAIQKLNDCENIDDAFVLMEDLKHQYLWDTTSTSYLSLCDLVRRRFL
jgi:hypothetical protein